jgi:hypothetical protein
MRGKTERRGKTDMRGKTRGRQATTVGDLGDNDLHNAQQIASLFGNPVSWWYQAAERELVPCYKMGRYVRFKPGEIKAWLNTVARRGPRPEAVAS